MEITLSFEEIKTNYKGIKLSMKNLIGDKSHLKNVIYEF